MPKTIGNPTSLIGQTRTALTPATTPATATSHPAASPTRSSGLLDTLGRRISALTTAIGRRRRAAPENPAAATLAGLVPHMPPLDTTLASAHRPPAREDDQPTAGGSTARVRRSARPAPSDGPPTGEEAVALPSTSAAEPRPRAPRKTSLTPLARLGQRLPDFPFESPAKPFAKPETPIQAAVRQQREEQARLAGELRAAEERVKAVAEEPTEPGSTWRAPPGVRVPGARLANIPEQLTGHFGPNVPLARQDRPRPSTAQVGLGAFEFERFPGGQSFIESFHITELERLQRLNEAGILSASDRPKLEWLQEAADAAALSLTPLPKASAQKPPTLVPARSKPGHAVPSPRAEGKKREVEAELPLPAESSSAARSDDLRTPPATTTTTNFRIPRKKPPVWEGDAKGTAAPTRPASAAVSTPPTPILQALRVEREFTRPHPSNPSPRPPRRAAATTIQKAPPVAVIPEAEEP